MIIAVLIVAAVVSIPIAGGSFSELSGLSIRGSWLMLFGLGIQAVVIFSDSTIDHSMAVAIHLASYGCAVIFCALNHRVRWMGVVGLGGSMNLVAIAANGGVMPASPWATHVAGIVQQPGAFANSTIVDHARLQFLGDILPIPKSWPFSNVFSVGDLFLVVGFVLVLHEASGARWIRSWPSAPVVNTTASTP